MASAQQVQNALRTSGFGLQIGPFSVKVRSRLTEVAEGIAFFYRDHPTPESEFFDFHISINPATPLRRWKNTHVNFDVDGIHLSNLYQKRWRFLRLNGASIIASHLSCKTI